MRRRRRRRKNTRRAFKIRIQKYLQDSFSAVLFFRAKMKIVAGDRARRENVPRHIRSSPLCLPGLTSSSRKCPVPACQCFLSRIFTAIENSRPPARTCAQKGGCLTIVFLIFYSSSTSGTRSQNPPHSGTVSRSPTPRDSLPRSLRSAQMSPEGRSFRPHEA